MGTRRCILLLVLAAAGRLPAPAAGEYGWPLAIHDGISSTFQEFRPNHFHAGVDFRTFQRTGFPVLAVADGVIEGLGMDNRGFGRTLRLRHADGNSSLYAHLERFRDDIESVVARLQAEKGKKYFGEAALSRPVAVRRGEVIAFSGESGYGFPHLHLEIRDGTGRALNPLRLIDGRAADPHEPRLKGVLVRSRGGSLVNGDCGEFYFKLHGQGGEFVLAEPIEISGSCDFTLEAFDLSDVRHVVAPYAIEARLDGRPVFWVSFDSLVRDDNNQLGMLYDMAYSSPRGYFFNIGSQTGFALEKTGVRLAGELENLAPGRHEIRAVVSDRRGNRATAVLAIVKVTAGEAAGPAGRGAAPAPAGDRLRALQVETFVNRGDITVKVRDLAQAAGRLGLRISQGGTERDVPARACGTGACFTFQPPGHDPRLLLRFEWRENGVPVEAVQRMLHPVLLRNHFPQTVSFQDFVAEFGPTSVREPTALLLDAVALRPDYPLLAGPVRSAPGHFAFLDAVFFKFRVPAGTERPEQLGIFAYRQATRKWTYVPTRPDARAGLLSCRVLTAGTFALLRDVFPPVISLRRPASRSLDKLKRLVVRIGDKGKGVDDASISLVLNDRALDAEYDPDWGHVLLEDPPGLRKGRNVLQVRAADHGGNASEKTFVFYLR